MFVPATLNTSCERLHALWDREDTALSARDRQVLRLAQAELPERFLQIGRHVPHGGRCLVPRRDKYSFMFFDRRINLEAQEKNVSLLFFLLFLATPRAWSEVFGEVPQLLNISATRQ